MGSACVERRSAMQGQSRHRTVAVTFHGIVLEMI